MAFFGVLVQNFEERVVVNEIQKRKKMFLGTVSTFHIQSWDRIIGVRRGIYIFLLYNGN